MEQAEKCEGARTRARTCCRVRAHATVEPMLAPSKTAATATLPVCVFVCLCVHVRACVRVRVRVRVCMLCVCVRVVYVSES